MVEITLFELHLPGAQFNAPFSGAADGEPVADDEDPADDGETAADDGESAAGPALALVAAVLVLALLVWLARGARRSGPDDDS